MYEMVPRDNVDCRPRYTKKCSTSPSDQRAVMINFFTSCPFHNCTYDHTWAIYKAECKSEYLEKVGDDITPTIKRTHTTYIYIARGHCK